MSVTENATEDVTESKGQGQGQGQGQLEKKKSSPVGEPKEIRPARLPRNFSMPAEWAADGQDARQRHELPPIDVALEAEKFCNFWWSKSRDGAKQDWYKTWINWCLNAKSTGNGVANGAGHKPTPVEKLYEGAYRAAHAFAARKQAEEGDARKRADIEDDGPLLDG